MSEHNPILAPEWIPVATAMPEEAEPVFVPGHPVPLVGYWDRDADLIVQWHEFGTGRVIDVECWLPFPQKTK